MKLVAAIVFFVLVGLGGNAGAQKAQKPNIILILADDMGYSDIGCYGSEIKTPNLDQLATEGVRFCSMYNNARCCPSRAALLSGLYPHQAGVGEMTDTDLPIPEYQGFFNNQTVTIADVLGSAGYNTYMSGKWHVGEEPGHRPTDHGFEHCFAFLNGASSYFDFKPYRNELWPPGNKLTVVRNNQEIKPEANSFYATDLYTDEAIRFINRDQKDKPFFLYLAYTAPHWPLHALPEDIQKYEGVYEAGWDVIRQNRYQHLQEIGLIDTQTKLSEKNNPNRNWKDLSPEEKAYEGRVMQVYAAMIDRMDQNIGRLMEQLKRNNQLENTVILFLSDNGGCAAGKVNAGKYGNPRFEADALPGMPESFVGYGKNWANVSNTPFREFKSDIHEGGISTPFIAWYPAHFPAGKINHSISHIVDVMPTLAELAGTKYPKEFKGKKIKPAQGKSLVSVIKLQSVIPERALYFEHLGKCGVIEGSWKIVRFRDEPWELYNLKSDRSEILNLTTEFPDKLNDLIGKYNRWVQENKVLPREEVEKAMIYQF